MLPYTIKSLTNCTELIDIWNKFGHGVSRSILEELATVNAFLVIDQQQENLVMPLEVSEDRLTRPAGRNSNRLEIIFANRFPLYTFYFVSRDKNLRKSTLYNIVIVIYIGSEIKMYYSVFWRANIHLPFVKWKRVAFLYSLLSGFGTTHKVNGILIQHGHFNTENLEMQRPKKKKEVADHFNIQCQKVLSIILVVNELVLLSRLFLEIQKNNFFCWSRTSAPNLGIISQLVVTASNGGDLCKFWLSFLDIVNVLLFTLYATRSGSGTFYWNVSEK